MTETSPPPMRRIRITDFYTAKRQHERWAMLTSYDQYTAELFDESGVWALLVGDSAANNVFGYETTLPVTVEDLLPLVRAVVNGCQSLSVPFWSAPLRRRQHRADLQECPHTLTLAAPHGAPRGAC